MLCVFVLLAGVAALSGCGSTKIVYVQSTAPVQDTTPSPTIPSSTGTGPASTSQGNTTGEATAVVQHFLDAVNRGDMNTAQSLWIGTEDDSDDWAERKQISFTPTSARESGTLTIEGKDVPEIMVYGVAKYTDDDGESEHDNYRFSVVKIDGGWKIVDDDD